MNAKLLLPLFALVLALGFGLWSVSNQSNSGAENDNALEVEDGGLAPAVADPAPEQGPELSGLAAPKDEVEETRVTAQGIEEETSFADSARRPLSDRRGVIWIEGRVEFAENTPLDEVLEVQARGKRFVGDRKGRRTHRVKVNRDGTFRVAVARTSKAATLRLIGKYSYLRDDFAWKKSSDEEVILKPRLGAHARVQVIRPAGLKAKGPLNASLQGIWRFSGDRPDKVSTEGLVEIGGLPTGRELQVRVTGDGVAKGLVDLTDLEEGKSHEYTLQLTQEARVVGQVMDNEDKPALKGSVVFTRRSGNEEDDNEDELIFELKRGHYEAKGLTATTYAVNFVGTGYKMQEQIVANLREGEERELDLFVGRGMVLRGTVHWATGEPAKGATVRLVGRDERAFFSQSGPVSAVEVDAEGNFEITGFEEVESIGLVAMGFPPGVSMPEDLSKIKARRWERENRVIGRADGVRPEGAPPAIILGTESGEIAGQVVDDLGQPIPKFRITASPVLDGPTPIAIAGRLRNKCDDPDGKFVLPGLAAGKWQVEATASAYKSAPKQVIELPTSKALKFSLPRAASISGKVVDADGTKVEASVTCRPIAQEGSNRGDSRRTQATKLLGFGFGGLDAGSYEIVASRSAEGSTEPVTVQVAVGDSKSDLVLKLPKPGRLSGSVHSDWLVGDGKLQVRSQFLSGENGSRRSGRGTRPVDSDGKFDFGDIAQGEYELELRRQVSVDDSDRMQGLELGVVVKASVFPDRSTVVRFEARPSSSIRLSGVLRRGDEELAGYIVSFTGLDPKRKMVETVTSAGGKYSVFVEGPGTYSVSAKEIGEWRSDVQMRITVGPGREQTKDLSMPNGTLLLKPTLAGGIPVEIEDGDGNFYLIGEEGLGTHDGESVSEEGIKFENLAPGKYQLRGSSVEIGGSELALITPAEVVVSGDTEVQEIPVEFGAGHRLSGTFTNLPEGRGRLNVVIYADESCDSYLTWERATDGAFSFDTVSPRVVWISRRWGSRAQETAVRVDLTNGPVTNLALDFSEM